MLDYLANLIKDVKVGMLCSISEGAPNAISITILPSSELDNRPQVIYLYSEGKKNARKELVKATVDFIKESGYTTFWAINYQKNMPDKVWLRLMKPEGWQVEPVGHIMEFKAND
jgi:hypothetical protein